MKRSHGVFAIVLGVLAALLSVSSTAPATASPTRGFYYYGYAGGSQVKALGATVKSDLTGASVVQGYQLPATDKNRVAGLRAAGGLVKIGAVTTWAKARKSGNGTTLDTGARTADISLLGGLIKADAVETNTSAKQTADGTKSSSDTRFLGLEVAGQKIPVDVKKNFTINVPGVATVILNYSTSYQAAGGTYSQGVGLVAQLLKPSGKLPAGATVVLNPTYSGVTPLPPSQVPVLGGSAYGTHVQVDAGTLLSVDAGPTAYVPVPPAGSGSKPFTNTTAGVDLPGVLEIGVVKSTTKGKTVPKKSRAKAVNQTAGINVLGGLIRADAIKAVSKTVKKPGKATKRRFHTRFVNLSIAGQDIPVNVGPNTSIDVAGLGRVTINEQSSERYGGTVIGVQVTLDTERAGLPIGAVIELAVAKSYVYA